MPSNHLILCHLPLLVPSVFPSIRVFSNESAFCIRWVKYWSFSFSIRNPNEYSGLISFRMDWSDLLAVQETLKSLLQHHSSKASTLQCSALFIVQLSHPYTSSLSHLLPIGFLPITYEQGMWDMLLPRTLWHHICVIFFVRGDWLLYPELQTLSRIHQMSPKGLSSQEHANWNNWHSGSGDPAAKLGWRQRCDLVLGSHLHEQ